MIDSTNTQMKSPYIRHTELWHSNLLSEITASYDELVWALGEPVSTGRDWSKVQAIFQATMGNDQICVWDWKLSEYQVELKENDFWSIWSPDENYRAIERFRYVLEQYRTETCNL